MEIDILQFLLQFIQVILIYLMKEQKSGIKYSDNLLHHDQEYEQNQQKGEQMTQKPINKVENEKIKWNQKKISLCRLYLRGNCQNTKGQCLFAHGIKDLVFKKYNQELQEKMKPIYFDFRNTHPINQLDVEVSQRDKNYINLYEFQLQLSKMMNQNKNKNRNNQNKKQIKQNDKIQQQKQQNSPKKKRHQYDHYKKSKQQTSKTNKVQIYNPCKQYTLQQINSNRNLKIQIRKRFHQNQFKLFLQLIERQYHSTQKYQIGRQYIFMYEILQLQYFRVGFNKLMTRIKLQFLIDYLVFQHKGGHFKFTSIMPPIRSKPITYYLKLSPQQQIFTHYRQTYHKLKKQFDQQGKKIRQQDVKLAMMKSVREWWKIPPILQLLRIKHCTFKDLFIRYIVEHHQGQQKIDLDWVTDQSILLSQIHKNIQDQIQKKQYCIVSTDILTKNIKFTRNLVQKCVQNQRKQQQNLNKKQKKEDKKTQNSQKLILIKCHNIKKQIITKQRYIKPQFKFQHQFGITLDVIIEDILELILNKMNKNKNLVKQIKFSNQNSKISPIHQQTFQKITHVHQKLNQSSPDTLEDYKIVEISTSSQFYLALQQMLDSSTILGIDLEGDLADQKGFLSLIQINHYSKKILYLIDYFTINSKQSQQDILKCKKILIKILNDNDIVKIIHDSRNDAECLYNLLNISQIKSLNTTPQYNIIKFTNIFDTAASQQVIRQVQDHNYKPNTPGLNQVLQKYGQNPNKHKQKFHSIWAEGKIDPSVIRPMSQQFKQYCLMDVLGLPKVYGAMSNKVNPYFLVFISQMHAQWSQNKQYKQYDHQIKKQKQI